MAESTRRLRNTTSRSIAASSVIALALGGLSVVAPGPLAPEAAAATLSGGIRDKSGAVEKDAQKASDLPAGSCVVQADNSQQGSQAGFSWYTSEPSASSPDKKAWGLSVSFDNSKDRTFADWGFTNNGRMGTYLDAAQISAMNAGQTLVDKVVTHKADEILGITTSGPQRPLNLNAKLTDAKVKQFAEATTANPVRYAWQGNYTKENPDGPRATHGANQSFRAVVNPWPSENIECNPITVSWENREKLVIRPGEELKVGKINVPAVQNGGTDDSMSRMVVEAYDAQGNFIGTSDTDASGADTPSVRIDETTGEIFYTMPKYKGTKLSDQQGMRFSVLAKPRSVEQLQVAVENNNGGEGQAFDSSNSLPRYNKPNVIANHQWSFDDTQFHDPKYDPDQQAIISGVEDNKPTKERQVVTFKEAGDKIADLVKKREDGGVDAEVKLDKKNVYSGWDVKMDPNTYEVTVTAPKDPRPGTFAQPRVIVTYSNGSRDIIPLLVVVDPNNTQVTTLVSPGTTTGVPGQPIDAQLTWEPVFEDRDPVQPTKYEVDPSTVPEGWTVKVGDDGTVTATAPLDAPNLSTISPEIKGIYPDGTSDTVKLTFQVINNVKVPDYTAVSGKNNEEVSLQPVMPPVGQGGKDTDEEPNRYTFEDGSTEYTTGDWTLKIDPDTGELSTTIPPNVFPGAQLTVPVKVHYATGANPQITTGTISVIGDKSGEDTAHYQPKLTKAGESVSTEFQSLLTDPKLATFKLPPKNQWPKDWEFTIDESGTITATPGPSVPNGQSVSIPVHVTYPDGSTAEVPADFTVVGTHARANQPSYPTVMGKTGTTVTSQVDRKNLSDASEPRFSLVTDPNDPDYIAPPRNLTWDQVKIDPVTGEIKTPIAARVLPGSSADIPVRVTYKDGSTDFTIATVVAQGEHRQIYEPKYEQKTTKPGEGVASSITEDTKVPDRDLATDVSKRYSVPDTVDGWAVKVDETGVVTATPPKTAKAGDGIQVPVTVTYLDGSQDIVLAPFKVRESQKDVYEPSYSVQDAGPGEELKRNVNLNNIPDGSTFSFGMQGDEPVTETTVDGWTYKIDPATGEVSVTPPANAKPGDKHRYNVSVTYPDGSIDEVPVATVVKMTNNWEANPTFPTETVSPGGTVTSPLSVDKPQDVNYAAVDPFVIDPAGLPAGSEPTGENNAHGNPTYKIATANGDWIVGLDKQGNVISTAPSTAKAGDKINVPVIVTYEDGSKDTTTATVNVEDAPTREVPFKVEYKYDNSIPAGTYKVETTGVPGAEKMNQDGTWERTEEPTNEVVVIGTKPAESAKDVTWKFPIPYPTEVRENPELKPGEMKTVQEGENGEKTYTAKFTSKGSEAQVAEEETTKEPVTRIIEVGPGIPDQELTSKKTQEVPFEIEYVYDDTLESGEQVVDEEGVPGEQTITSTQKIVDGKPDGEPAINVEETKAPKKAKIRVGTKTTGENTELYKAETPYNVVVKYDPNMPAGESKVTTKGQPGEKTVTIKRDIVNSKPGDPQITEEITKQPVDEVITVGTKPSEASEKVTWTAQVPFEVETRPNPALKPGEIKVAQQGVPGEKTYTADFAAKGDQATVTPEEKQTKAPVNEIIEYGPAAEDTSVVTKVEKPVPFDTEIVFDDTLAEGEQVVDQQGELGTEVVTSTQKIVDGKSSGEPTVTTEQTKAPKNAIIRVGTKQPDPEEPAPAPSPSTEPLTVELPYPTRIVHDPNLPAGEEVVDQEGTPGSKTLRPKLEMVDGKQVWTVEEVETQKPVQRVVRVGIKQAETNPFTWTSEVPYNTIVRPNPELKPGETRVVQVGENGSTKYSANPETGEVTKLEDKKPVERIVEYGPTEDTLVTKVTRPVSFETEVVYDPDLPEGAQRIEQGEFGEEVETTTQQIKDGKPFGDPAKNTERTREPKNAVIRIGTKKTPKDASVTELDVPPTTQLIFDPSLKPGEQVVVREGTPGTVRVTTVDGETSVENIKDAIPRLIRVGAKQPDELNWLEALPFKVITSENPDLPAGEHKVIQEGKPGLVQHVGETATTVTEAQDYILEIGTAKELQEKREVITEPVPFETIFIEDDTLAAGVVKVDSHGETGLKRTTKVWEMKDGKELGDPTVTDETLSEPKNLIIRVGTGKPVEDPDNPDNPEDPKPEQPKPEDPKAPEDEKGSSAERCVANTFAANSPLLWLLPIGLLGAVGYGVNEAFGPQINQVTGQLNARWQQFVRENTPDFGHGGRGIEKPEWMREMEAQANALNQQFNQRYGGYGEQLRPVGIALGALAAAALTGTLIAQACTEEGFDNGMTVLGSTERKLDFGASSEKADGAKAGSSSRESGSSKKTALTTAAKPTGEK
ncbi:G5 domain-containing protein [Corynebacterium sp. HMSC05H05]|uniref:G5 domain-containing protein n=1 Tax=Corynebacterium sp. HMSC05H05 TaxID=1581119 RepID=UPI0009F171A0|nr:G5 domain-containing protein [Corynebacterium sp. HMSC05H05]